MVDRTLLFNLDLTNAEIEANPFSLMISSITAQLTVDAAQALNQVFAVDSFIESFTIGPAQISALF